MPSDLKERYERCLVQARNFAAVIEVVDRLGMPPDGVNVSRLTWRKEVGRTTYYGRIARLVAEIPALILNVAYVTPDTRPEHRWLKSPRPLACRLRTYEYAWISTATTSTSNPTPTTRRPSCPSN